MQRNNIIVMAFVLVVFLIITSAGQKKVSQYKGVNVDSLAAIAISKNATFIEKRVTEMKKAEKAADSLKSVVVELKQENQELHEKIGDDTDGVDLGNANLLPISKN